MLTNKCIKKVQIFFVSYSVHQDASILLLNATLILFRGRRKVGRNFILQCKFDKNLISYQKQIYIYIRTKGYYLFLNLMTHLLT